MEKRYHLCSETPAIRQHWLSVLGDQAHPCQIDEPWPKEGVAIVEVAADDLQLEQIAEQLQQRTRDTLTLVISPRPSAPQGLTAVRLGARGYLHALAHPERIREALRALESGQAWLSQEVIAAMSQQLARNIPSDRWKEGLTEREIQIVEQLLDGRSNKDIANILHISENTVKTHLKHLFDKFNAKDRLALVLKIQRLARGEEL